MFVGELLPSSGTFNDRSPRSYRPIMHSHLIAVMHACKTNTMFMLFSNRVIYRSGNNNICSLNKQFYSTICISFTLLSLPSSPLSLPVLSLTGWGLWMSHLDNVMFSHMHEQLIRVLVRSYKTRL